MTAGRALWVLSPTAGATQVGETQGVSQGPGGGESEIGPAHSPAHTGHSPMGTGGWGLHRSIHTVQASLCSARRGGPCGEVHDMPEM